MREVLVPSEYVWVGPRDRKSLFQTLPKFWFASYRYSMPSRAAGEGKQLQYNGKGNSMTFRHRGHFARLSLPYLFSRCPRFVEDKHTKWAPLLISSSVEHQVDTERERNKQGDLRTKSLRQEDYSQSNALFSDILASARITGSGNFEG